MRRTISFVIVATTILFSECFNVIAQEQVTAPTHQDGDFWEFKAAERDFASSTSDPVHGIFRIVYSGGKFSVFEVDSDQKNLRGALTGDLFSCRC